MKNLVKICQSSSCLKAVKSLMSCLRLAHGSTLCFELILKFVAISAVFKYFLFCVSSIVLFVL